MKGPTDTQRLWTELHRAGRQGLHSFDIRARLGMGNPSQRVIEIETDHACSVPRRREKRNGRIGVRYFHPDHAPAGLGDGGSIPSSGTVAEPSRGDEPRSRPAEPPPSASTLADAADPDRTPQEAEQLGLIDTGPSIYDAAA